jgi:hypothetical protein
MAIRRKGSNKLSKLSAFSHAESHLLERTVYGGLISLATIVFALWLVVSEGSRCLSLTVAETMDVDMSREETMPMRFNVTFPHLPCRAIRFTMGDSSGNFETESMMKLEHMGEVHKWRLDDRGRRMERQEYHTQRGADNPFQVLLDYDDVKSLREEIVAHHGCEVAGWANLRRVAGNMALLVRQEAILAAEDDVTTMEALIQRHMRHMGGAPIESTAAHLLNSSHIINTFRFGTSYKGQKRPLESSQRIDRKATGLDKYFVKVVPVTQISYFGRKVHSHDYSVTEYYEDIVGKTGTLPGVIVMYDLWPIRVTKATGRLGFLHLSVRLCAVIGGLWTVCGIVNRSVHAVILRTRRAFRTNRKLTGL